MNPVVYVLLVAYSLYLLAAATGVGAIAYLVYKDMTTREHPDTPTD